MFNSDIATAVADMGFKSILCEKRDDMFFGKGEHISPNAIFRATNNKGKPLELLVIPRNRELSDDVAYKFKDVPITADHYAWSISQIAGEAVMMGYDYEHIGEHFWQDSGIFEFWKHLPQALSKYPNIIVANPREIVEKFKNTECPLVDIHSLATSSWADTEKNTFGWLGGTAQYTLFQKIEAIEKDANKVKGELREKWRHLTTSDQVYYLHEAPGHDNIVHSYFSPYDRSAAMAAHVLTEKVQILKNDIKNFQILKKTERTPVIIISPETARLPSEEMGELAQYVSAKTGGQGDVVAALCKGLVEREIPTHFITLNLRERFMKEAKISEEEWIHKRHNVSPGNIHLVTNSLFENYHTPYDYNPAETAGEFQRQIISHYIREVRSRHSKEGKVIVHTHDWMSGGAVSAYAKARGIPTLHTVHNTHTGHIPLDMFKGVNLGKFQNSLYKSIEHGRECIDSQATAIKSSYKINYVGKRFLEEVIQDYFMDRWFIPPSVKEETKMKYRYGSALVIPNGISPDDYPENQKANLNFDKTGLAMSYGNETKNVIEAKKANLLKFQRKIGLQKNPNAILLYWPSRLDANQKGIELLEDIALKFVIEHGDAQIAIVGNPVGDDKSHAEVLGRIACASKGKIAYHHFDDDLSTLGYASASDVFGASLYEPFGLIDVTGNLYGATSTNRDTGGYHDKIINLELKAWNAPQDVGNGVLFKNYDSGGLWWGLNKTVQNHRYFRNNPKEWNKQAKRIMKEAKEKHSSDAMVARYITVYQELNNGKPLA